MPKNISKEASYLIDGTATEYCYTGGVKPHHLPMFDP